MLFEPTSVDRLLLIATRQIGDVLLVTPLLASLRKAYPVSQIDVLVFRGKGGMLEGNPHLDHVIEISEKPAKQEYISILRRLFRRYDLAVNTQANDRAHLFALVAARRRVGFVYEHDWRSAWKRTLNVRWAWFDNVTTHTVTQNLALAELLQIEPFTEVVPPRAEFPRGLIEGALRVSVASQYAVIHINPMWTYKCWTHEGWATLIQYLRAQQLHVFISGGAKDREACADMVSTFDTGVTSLAGQLCFGELAQVLAGARLFVGPDTAVTHLAAAAGIPVVALYGPSNPIKWGPWPKGYAGLISPWRNIGKPWQRQNNVLLLQGVNPLDREPCVPCYGEGCDRHKGSFSVCLQRLDARQVLQACEALLR